MTAKHRNNNLVGAWMDDTLQSANRIRALPKVAVMERKMNKAEKNICSPAGICMIMKVSFVLFAICTTKLPILTLLENEPTSRLKYSCKTLGTLMKKV